MDRFLDALEGYGFVDLGYAGDIFTWRNQSRIDAHYIRERLDRAIADEAWCSHFQNFSVRDGEPRHSNHKPVIVSLEN